MESVVGVVAGMEVVLVGKSVGVAVVLPGDGWTLVTPTRLVTRFPAPRAGVVRSCFLSDIQIHRLAQAIV